MLTDATVLRPEYFETRTVLPCLVDTGS